MSDNPPCQLRDDDWCDRHQRFHRGPVRVLALAETEVGKRQRLAWDKATQVRTAEPTADTGPSPLRTIFNFGVALASHIGDGMAKRSKEDIENILRTHCQPCPLFDGIRCTHISCGCNVNGEERFFNMLAWRSKKCPIGNW